MKSVNTSLLWSYQNISLLVQAFSRTVTFSCFAFAFLEPHYLPCVLSDGGIHRGMDIVCGDYGIVNAPFSGNLGGPVGRAVGDSVQYDGVKLYNKGICYCPCQ